MQNPQRETDRQPTPPAGTDHSAGSDIGVQKSTGISMDSLVRGNDAGSQNGLTFAQTADIIARMTGNGNIADIVGAGFALYDSLTEGASQKTTSGERKLPNDSASMEKGGMTKEIPGRDGRPTPPRPSDGYYDLPPTTQSTAMNPHPENVPTEAPAAAAIADANKTLERLAGQGEGLLNPDDQPISAETQTALQGLLNADFAGIQKMLKDAQGNPEAIAKLHAMARELTSLTSTTVKLQEGEDGALSLSMLSNFDNPKGGGFSGAGVPQMENRLIVSADSVTATTTRDYGHNLGSRGRSTVDGNVETEAARMQQLAVRGLEFQAGQAAQNAAMRQMDIIKNSIADKGPKVMQAPAEILESIRKSILLDHLDK